MTPRNAEPRAALPSLLARREPAESGFTLIELLAVVGFTAVLMLFALTLAARTWVKSHEDKSAALARRAEANLEAFTNAQHNAQGGAPRGDDAGDGVRRTG